MCSMYLKTSGTARDAVADLTVFISDGWLGHSCRNMGIVVLSAPCWNQVPISSAPWNLEPSSHSQNDGKSGTQFQ